MVEATGSRPTSETFLPYTVSDQQGNEQESYREILDTVLMLAETNPPNPRPPGEDPFELPVIPKPSFNLASDSESQFRRGPQMSICSRNLGKKLFMRPFAR
ncbi:MAG: hypothetical protein P8077_10285 [Gammaproteobacteria bacterium]